MTSLAPPIPAHLLYRHGCWFAAQSAAISYPADGNAACAQIEEHSFWFRHRNRCILDLLERLPPGGPLWDIGGGNGFVSMAMQNAGHDVVLIEPGEAGARAAQTRGVRNVVCATFQDLDVRTGSLPAAGMFDVLEHIADDTGFLRSLNTAMRTDGRFYLIVPAYNLLWSSEDDHAGHYRRYSVGSLTKVLKEAGFTVEFASPFFLPLTLPLFLLRTIPSAFGLRGEVNAKTTTREHTSPKGPLGRLFDRMLERERMQLLRGKRGLTGTSLIAVARKEQR